MMRVQSIPAFVPRKVQLSGQIVIVSGCMRLVSKHLQEFRIIKKPILAEANAEAYAESGIEREWINGLLLSRGHYDMVDIEQYKFNLLRALDIIENRPIEDSPQPVLKIKTDEQDQNRDASSSAGGEDSLRETVLLLIDSLDKGEGVDFDAILSNTAARGFSRDAAEEVLDELSEEGILHEPRFGWFKRT